MWIVKKSPIIGKIPFVYKLFQKYLRIPGLKKILEYIENRSIGDISVDFDKMKNLCINELLWLKTIKNLYILFPFPSVGEYALSFLLLKNFLYDYEWNIYIVCSENTIDIANIFSVF